MTIYHGWHVRGNLVAFFKEVNCQLCGTYDNRYTYQYNDGKSTIDLLFSNVTDSFITSFQDETVSLRKHRPQTSWWRMKVPLLPSRPVVRRKINPDLINPVMIQMSLQESQRGNIDEALKVMNGVITAASPVPKKKWRRHQPWYDKECREVKRLLLINRNSVDGARLKTLHYQYRNLLKKKRKEYFDEQVVDLVLKSEKEPWLLKPWQQHHSIPWEVPTEEINSHFKNLFTDKSPGTPFVMPENTQDWTPFSEEEVVDAILSLPNKKVPGLDNITSEQLGSLLFLSHAWTTETENNT